MEIKPGSKIRQQLADEYGVDIKTFHNWLIDVGIELDKGAIYPKKVEEIYEKLERQRFVLFFCGFIQNAFDEGLILEITYNNLDVHYELFTNIDYKDVKEQDYKHLSLSLY